MEEKISMERMKTFKKQIEEAPLFDHQFQLENISKNELLENYGEQLTISHELNFKNEELKEEIKQLKYLIESLETSILIQGIKLSNPIHTKLEKLR